MIAFYLLAGLLIWFSFKSFMGGLAYLRYFRSYLSQPPSAFTPFATVIAPWKGLENGFENNLRSLFHQDYPEYEIILALDDESDPALPVIREAISRFCDQHRQAKILVVSDTTGSSSRKVEKLREAVLHANERSQVFVFVDSDVCPAPNWLSSLAGPLADDHIGASTGYRWFISERLTLASELTSVWNASIASALGPNTDANFTWGGSTGIRRDVFDRLQIRDRWKGTLSDDFTLTRALREAKLPIIFVPAAVSASLISTSFRQMLEFTTRQMKITRVYMPHLWLMSFLGSAVFNIVMGWAVVNILLWPTYLYTSLTSALTLLLVILFSVGKSWLRLDAIHLVLKGYSASLRRQLATQNTLWALAPAVFLYNCIAALLSREITWRGTTYKLKSHTETVIIRG